MDQVTLTLWMERILFFLALFCIGSMIAGLARPDKVLWWSRVKTRERVVLLFGPLSLAFFVMLFAWQLSFAFSRG